MKAVARAFDAVHLSAFSICSSSFLIFFGAAFKSLRRRRAASASALRASFS